MVGITERTVQRWRQEEDGGDDRRRGPNTVPGNKLSEHEERRLLRVLNSPELRDLSPRQVIPALAEQGTYIASEATAYRVLHKHGMQKHRESTRPATSRKPDELVAAAPNQVYCWDITCLKRSVLGTFFYLYLVTDIFSRRIVAARVYEAENDEHAAELFVEVQQHEQLAPGQAHLHSDNGSAMKGATLKATLEASRCSRVPQPSGRQRRQSIRRVTVRDHENARGLSEEALRYARTGAGVGGRLRALVQRGAST